MKTSSTVLLVVGGAVGLYLLRGKLGGGPTGTPNNRVGVQRMGVQPAGGSMALAENSAGGRDFGDGVYVAYPGQSLISRIAGNYAGPAQQMRIRHIPATAAGTVYASGDTLKSWFDATFAAHPEWFQAWTVDLAAGASPTAFSTTSPAYVFASGGTTYGLIVQCTLLTEGTVLYFGARDKVRVVAGNLSNITIR